MKLALLTIISLGSLAAFGQQSTVIGTINRLADKEITVKTPRRLFTIYAADRTEVVKDKIYRGFSPLKVGDEISARCEPNSSGKLVAIKLWANVVTFSATVKYINGDEIEVVTIPNADYSREEHRIIHFYPDTAFGTNRKDVTVGQSVRIVGLDVGNGAVDAARVALYNTYTPTDRGTQK
jgi:Domain of unknown function (DUF5666)